MLLRCVVPVLGVPDALDPLDGLIIQISLLPGETTAIWVSIDVPSAQPHGIYQGEFIIIAIRADAESSAALPRESREAPTVQRTKKLSRTVETFDGKPLGEVVLISGTCRVVAITQENSLLDNTARIERWIARFPMFDWVDGRTSVMSSVGLLPAALQGTRSALYANDRESFTVTVQEVTPRSVGALVAVALYERAIGIYASLVNINSYHQPGVEAGKKAAGEVLALQVLNEASCKEPVETLTLDEVADRCHAPEEVNIISFFKKVVIYFVYVGSPRSIKVFLGECNVDDLYA